MKIIECKQDTQVDGKGIGLGRTFGNLTLPIGRQSQEIENTVIQTFQKKLDHRFVCLSNFYPRDATQTPALILIGPQGVYLFRISTIKGIFRAAGDSWEELDTRSKKFNPVKTHLLSETLQMSNRLDMELATTGIDLPVTEPIVYFANPGAHVDAEKPIVRVLLIDALDRFLSSLLRLPQVLEKEQIEKLVDALQQKRHPRNSETSELDEHDIFSLHDPKEKQSQKGPSIPKPVFHEPGVLKKLQFSRRQWIILGILTLFTIVILVALVLVILILT